MRISDFIERSNNATTLESLFSLYQAAVASFGYDRICFAPATPAAQQTLDAAPPGTALALKCPDDWIKHYLANRYYEIDPVLLTTPVRRWPFFWDEIKGSDRFSSKQKRIIDESEDAGLLNGLSVPIHGPRGESFLISLASDANPGPNNDSVSQLHVLSTQFFLAFAHMGQMPDHATNGIRLTKREHECLSWTARGKSAWAVSMILGVSEHTINFYIKSAMRKLGTTNRVQAVALAVRYGLISP
jgi:LuxR family quorum-sensing system transcriptional regulator CciR